MLYLFFLLSMFIIISIALLTIKNDDIDSSMWRNLRLEIIQNGGHQTNPRWRQNRLWEQVIVRGFNEM